MRRVIVTRPEAASEALAHELAEHGLEALAAPMLRVEPLEPDEAGPADVQAVLMTSANGADGAARLTDRRDLPVLAVGDASAEAARSRGFTQVETASGDGNDLLDLVSRRCRPDDGPLLWASGEAVSTDLTAPLSANGFHVARRVVYRTTTPDSLPDAVVNALRTGTVEGVLFFSPRSANAFATLASKAGLETACADVAAYCMSTAIARSASTLAWRAIHVAVSPTKSALIAALLGGETHGDRSDPESTEG